MTRADALRALLEKVETGEATWSGSLIFEAFGGHRQKLFHDAFHGSLDAAKALHEAVPTPDAIMTDEMAQMILFGRNGARTWLEWKLKALIATEDN